MKNILLVNPWIYDFAAYDLWMFPLGLLNIAAYLKKHALNIQFLDFLDRHEQLVFNRQKDYSRTAAFGTGHFFKQEVSKPEIVGQIRRKFFRYGLPPEILRQKIKFIKKPDLILVTSGMTYWYKGLEQSISFLREIFPQCPIILGGIYARLCPEHARKNSKADYIFSGAEIDKVLSVVEDFLKIPLNQGQNQNSLPSFELLSNYKVLPILGSCGCPFRCTYCASNVLYPDFEQKDPGEVLNYISGCVQNFKPTDFIFYDDALLVNAENFIKPILKEVIKANLSVRFHTPNGLHARFIDEELAQLMYRANFKTIRLSLESTSSFFQQKSSEKVSNRDFKKAVKLLKKAGFRKQELGVYTMIGFPGQTKRDILDDMEFVSSSGAEIFLSSYCLVPQTQEWNIFIKKGMITNDEDPLLFSHTAFALLFAGFDGEMIRGLRRKASKLNKA